MTTTRSLIPAAVLALCAIAAPVRADVHTFTATLSGSAESPPTGSAGIGFVTVTIDDVADTMHVVASFSGLSSGNTAAHIHCCTATPGTGNAGVATVTPTFTAFPSGATSGTYDHLFDMTLSSSWNPAFITANGGTPTSAFATFLGGVEAGESYFNIHTTNFGGGEIRGFLVTAVPEPSTWALLSGGFALLAAGAARRRRRG